MLVYKTVSGTKNFKKLVHLTAQFLALCLSLLGFWAAWKFHVDKGIDNFYSLHSWLGLTCTLLFAVQVLSHCSVVCEYFAIKILLVCQTHSNLYFFGSVGGCIRSLLVPWWFEEQQSYITSMARIPWSIHLCRCHCNGYYRFS